MEKFDVQTAFDLFFENSNDLMLVLDSDCCVVRINPTCFKIFGYQPKELIGKHIMQLVHSDDMARGEQQIKAIFKSEGVNFPFKNKAIHKDGTTRYLSWSSQVIDGYLYATGVDITLQEEKLRNIEYVRRKYLSRNDSGIGLWEINTETHDFLGDEHVYEIFGLPFQISCPLRSLEFILTPESHEIVVSHLDKVINSNIFENFDCEIIRQTDKQIRTISVTGNFIFDENFNIKSFFGTMQDITEQKAIASKLSELNTMQSTMLGALEPLVALYTQEGIQWANKNEMLGYTLDYMKDKPISCVFKNYDDYVRIKAEAYQTMAKGDRYTIDFEAVSFKGDSAWIHLSGKLLTPQSVIWTASDITEQKNATLSIAKSHALLKDTQKAAHIGCWESIEGGKTIKIDEATSQTLDLGDDAKVINIDLLMEIFDEEGRKYLEESVAARERGETFMSFDCHVRTKKNNVKHLNISGGTLKESGRVVGIVQDITRMELLERELEEKRRRIDAIYATSPTAIGLIHGYNIFDCNNEFYRLTGYNADELLDKGLKRIMSQSELERLNRKALQVPSNMAVHSFETVFLRKSGRKVNVLLNFSIFETDNQKQRSSIISVTDITALKIAQQTNYQLVESINQSQSEFIIYDSNWIAVYANDKVFEAHNLTSADIIGQPIKEFDLNNKQHKAMYQKLMETGFVSGEYQANQNDAIWYNIRISPIYDQSNNKITGYVSVKDNITDQKNMQMELMKALSKAEQSDRMKETLLQNLSHEVRTPLNAISGFAEIISDSDNLPAATLKSYTNIISNSCNQLLGIVSDMLVMSDIQLGRVSVAVNRIMLDEMLNRLHRIFLQQAQDKNISLEYVAPADRRLAIYSDETKLAQILTNLLTNAIKFTDKGGVKFGYSVSDKQVDFFVEDTGIGISDENKQQIFERFFQVTKNKASSRGTGLGLAISQSFAKMLHGEILVESELGKGSVFHLIVPINA